MARQEINIGTSADDETGDDLRSGGEKINANFAELYNAVPLEALFEDRKAAGTNGGATVAGVWTQRALNTERYDEIGITLAANRLLVPAGAYKAYCRSQLYKTDRARIRLWDVTNGVVLAESETSYTPGNTSASQLSVVIEDRFTLSDPAEIEIQYRVETATALNGLGVASNFSLPTPTPEIYSRVKLVRLPPA